jgi:hypothetical protein
MTEAEWVTSDDCEDLLEFCAPRASERKLRLFATACCRRVTHLMPDPRSLRALEANERYADGRASRAELTAALAEAEAAFDAVSRGMKRTLRSKYANATWAVQAACSQGVVQGRGTFKVLV